MATALKLKNDIKKLKAAISSKATPKSFVPKLKAQLDKAENELASLKKSGRPRKTSTTKGTATTLSALQKLIQKKKFGVYQGAGVDLKKDAGEGAFATGRRVSKGLKSNQWGDASENKGNVYYEYRPNRLDVKQPKKKQTYPKLEDGGMMAKGGINAANLVIGKKYEYDYAKDGTNYKIEYLGTKEDLKNKRLKIDFKIGSGGYVFKFDNDKIVELSKPSINKILSEMEYADGGMMAKGGKLESGVYRIGKPSKVSQNLYEQKIVEIFDNGDIATASDYGRKMSDFSGSTYPIISQEELEAQYKMAYGGYMAKGGETVPYIIWVSKDGEKRELYGNYKSQRAADMAMRKLWDSSDYKSMGNKPKSMYEKQGLYAKGGGVYSSDSLYILTISKDGNMVGHEPFRAKNMKEAREIAEDMEEKYTSKLGDNVEFSIKQAMAKGGEVVKYYGVEFTNTFGISKDDFKKAIDSFYDTGSDVNYERVAARLNISNLTKELGQEKSKEVFGYIKSKFEKKGVYSDGGEVGQGFLIRDMREKLNKMFPDTFGFTVGNISKEGNEVQNSSALVVDRRDPYRGLEDKDIQSRLFFPQYKRDHDIRFRIYQGGENTYFYFLLESENGDQYIGQFGFKDQGDVLPDYITRFIAFLMEQYGLPFEVKHSVMAKGGYMAGGGMMAEGGELNREERIKKLEEKRDFFPKGTGFYQKYDNSIRALKKTMPKTEMAKDGEMHKADHFKDGGEVFSEKKLKEILDEALGHFYQGLNQVDLAMRYLEVKGQGGLKKPLSDKLKLDGLKESIEKIDEYISK
jgi:hypothetical protein